MASSGQISLLREGEDVWSWFQAVETISQAAVPNRPVPVRPAPPALPAVPVVAVPAVPEPLRPKYDFYTELPKRQVGIQ